MYHTFFETDERPFLKLLHTLQISILQTENSSQSRFSTGRIFQSESYENFQTSNQITSFPMNSQCAANNFSWKMKPSKKDCLSPPSSYHFFLSSFAFVWHLHFAIALNWDSELFQDVSIPPLSGVVVHSILRAVLELISTSSNVQPSYVLYCAPDRAFQQTRNTRKNKIQK